MYFEFLRYTKLLSKQTELWMSSYTTTKRITTVILFLNMMSKEYDVYGAIFCEKIVLSAKSADFAFVVMNRYYSRYDHVLIHWTNIRSLYMTTAAWKFRNIWFSSSTIALRKLTGVPLNIAFCWNDILECYFEKCTKQRHSHNHRMSYDYLRID